jgi:hypothetical protein
MIGQDIINEALLVLVVIYPGQTISSEAQATALLGLNNLLDEWNAQGLAVYSIIKVSGLTLTSGAPDYTIGSGATLNTARPEKIEAWRVIDASGAANGGSPVSAKVFAANSDDSTLSAARIEMLNYDAAYPTGTVHVYPKPNATCTLELWVWEQLAAISDPTLTLSLPPGYGKALIYNLAVDLAPKFGRPLDPNVQQIANAAKATIGATNISEDTRVPPAAAAPAAQRGRPQMPVAA